MFADFIRCTHNGTGGSSTITLAAITGWPQPTDAFSASGTRLVDYAINEYTDSTKAVLSKSETGRGSLVLSTNVLTRSVPRTTWDGTTHSAANPSAISFGNTAANIDIILTTAAAGQSPACPVVQGSVFDLFDTRSIWDSAASTVTLVAGTKYYQPIEYRDARPVTAVAVDCSSIATTGNVRMSLYDWGTDGWPANLITEFTASSQIGINTSTGIKSVSLGSPLGLAPGFYFVMLQADANVVLRTVRHYSRSGLGQSQRDYVYATKTGSYGAAPSPADTSLTLVSLSAAAKLAAMFR